MMTCPRCGTPASLMASEEFSLLDCECCDDVIDLSLIDQELPEPEPAPAEDRPGGKGGWFRSRRGLPASLVQATDVVDQDVQAGEGDPDLVGQLLVAADGGMVHLQEPHQLLATLAPDRRGCAPLARTRAVPFKPAHSERVTPRASALELRDFADLVERGDFRGWERQPFGSVNP